MIRDLSLERRNFLFKRVGANSPTRHYERNKWKKARVAVVVWSCCSKLNSEVSSLMRPQAWHVIVFSEPWRHTWFVCPESTAPIYLLGMFMINKRGIDTCIWLEVFSRPNVPHVKLAPVSMQPRPSHDLDSDLCDCTRRNTDLNYLLALLDHSRFVEYTKVLLLGFALRL